MQIGSQVLWLDRAAQLAATVALGLWAAKGLRPWASALVILTGAWCVAWALLPRGPWPSYSWPDAALCVAVACAMSQLVSAQSSRVLAVAACFGLALWIVDSLVMAPVCGAMIDWNFTASTACGSLVGDYRAMVPTLLVLGGWLAWLRRAGPN